MKYIRICSRCGDQKKADREAARGYLCRACFIETKGGKRQDCDVCHLPFEGHPRCTQCTILLGPLHWYQDAGDGRCSDCLLTPTERAGLLETNVIIQQSNMGGAL